MALFVFLWLLSLSVVTVLNSNLWTLNLKSKQYSTSHNSTNSKSCMIYSMVLFPVTLCVCIYTFTLPQLFAVAATLKSIGYNVAMTFILNNNNNISFTFWECFTVCIKFLLYHCQLVHAIYVTANRAISLTRNMRFSLVSYNSYCWHVTRRAQRHTKFLPVEYSSRNNSASVYFSGRYKKFISPRKGQLCYGETIILG